MVREPISSGQTAALATAANPVWRLAQVVLIVAVLWTISSAGYYALVDALGIDSGYNDAPLLFTAYYLGWTGVTVWLFRDMIADQIDRWMLAQETLVMLPILALFAAYVVFVLPYFPQVSEVRAPSDPPEFMFASAWYYLPKSADILFQQAIVAALILTSARAGFSLVSISLGIAAAFGSFHLSLAFDGFTPTYVTRFVLAATAFGALLPYLYLRVRRGFRWAYSLHWGFYAVDATLTHFILAAPPWAQS